MVSGTGEICLNHCAFRVSMVVQWDLDVGSIEARLVGVFVVSSMPYYVSFCAVTKHFVLLEEASVGEFLCHGKVCILCSTTLAAVMSHLTVNQSWESYF